MAGYVASNVVEGLVEPMQWHEVDAYVEDGGLLVDVRDEAERMTGYIPGSVCIPLNDLRNRLHASIRLSSRARLACGAMSRPDFFSSTGTGCAIWTGATGRTPRWQASRRFRLPRRAAVRWWYRPTLRPRLLRIKLRFRSTLADCSVQALL